MTPKQHHSDQAVEICRHRAVVYEQARKLRSNAGSRIYAQRKAIVEPVNGQIEATRDLRSFLHRGTREG